MPMLDVTVISPRPRPADIVLHTLVAAHRSGSAFVRSEGNDNEAGEENLFEMEGGENVDTFED